jgi:predicted transglutaminase-like cysteine proteinase
MKHSDLQEVNALVNNSVTYQSDTTTYLREEQWEVADKIGDCEDYALRKLRELLARGWPIEKLKLATCWVENNLGYHAVLIVDEEDGERWVLDNRSHYIYRPELGFNGVVYEWDRIQQEGGSKTWVKM